MNKRLCVLAIAAVVSIFVAIGTVSRSRADVADCAHYDRDGTVDQLFDCLEGQGPEALQDHRFLYLSAVADYRAYSVAAGDRMARRFRSMYTPEELAAASTAPFDQRLTNLARDAATHEQESLQARYQQGYADGQADLRRALGGHGVHVMTVPHGGVSVQLCSDSGRCSSSEDLAALMSHGRDSITVDATPSRSIQ